MLLQDMEDPHLKIKYNQYFSKYPKEKAILYRDFYKQQYDNEYLIGIFSLFHSNLNDLFTFMNSKSRGYGGHFNAEESRRLIDIIEQIRILEKTLKDKNSFEVDKYYLDVITLCKTFLTPNYGSEIPEDFSTIEIIENRAVFTRPESTTIKSVNQSHIISMHQIGGGSYGTVFRYTDPHYGNDYAIKRAKNNLEADELERFKNEYYDLKSLDSPFIIKGYNYNSAKNEYTLELADQTLEKYMRYNNNILTLEKRKNLIHQLLHAFDYIHKKGILHRDISYQNILIKKHDDGYVTIKVSDFGLVKRPESSLTRDGTKTKGAINDYSYLDVVGFKNYEVRHETYALAKVIYYVLTGKQNNYSQEENPTLRKFIMKAIGNKEDRFTSVSEMKKVLFAEVIPSMNPKA
jgi:eukaryotic-like serine/threonine-protein kinase